MDAEELRELADKLEDLKKLQEQLEDAYSLLNDLEGDCSTLGIMPSHSASMEIGDCLSEVTDAISKIESLR
jgi:DNA repair ATPase RecN|tara:strand:+ start:465 stop:677 length:213 start_codon:yes stop_codon:yes gene_type:complete